jgi:hypothetical protein
MLKVLKYGTGQEIPAGAVFLSTQTETRTYTVDETLTDDNDPEQTKKLPVEYKQNVLVWHYFLVEVPEGQ